MGSGDRVRLLLRESLDEVLILLQIVLRVFPTLGLGLFTVSIEAFEIQFHKEVIKI